MAEMTLSAPATFENPVLYGVEVEVNCRVISIEIRREMVNEVLSFWPTGNLMMDECQVEMTDGHGTPIATHDPCKPWMRGKL